MTTAPLLSSSNALVIQTSRGSVLSTLRRFVSPPVVRWRAVLAGGFLGSLLIVVTAPVRLEARHSWRLTLPFVPHPGNAVFSTVTFVAGIIAMAVAWIRLTAYATDRTVPQRKRVRMVILASTLWVAPLLLGPPLLSNDVYSYAAQGELASRGVDPTLVGPNALGGGPFMRAADSVWWNNPAPYGPIWNDLSQHLVVAAGHDPAVSVWMFRGVMVLSVIVIGVALYDMTRESNPALALAIGVANPVTLQHLIGGIHNDALMIALMVCSLALARRRRFVIALLLMIAATGVKLPAAPGLAFLGWQLPLARSSAQRLLSATVTAVVGVVTTIALTFAMGMRLGWIAALKGTSKIMSTFAPMTMLGQLGAGAFRTIGFNVDTNLFVSASRLAGLAGAGLLSLWMLKQSDRFGVERSLGVVMALTIFLGPVLWPWYTAVAFVILAASDIERFRMACLVWGIAVTFFVMPITSVSSGSFSNYHAATGMALIILLTLLSVGFQALVGDPAVPSRLARPLATMRRQPAAEAELVRAAG